MSYSYKKISELNTLPLSQGIGNPLFEVARDNESWKVTLNSIFNYLPQFVDSTAVVERKITQFNQYGIAVGGRSIEQEDVEGLQTELDSKADLDSNGKVPADQLPNSVMQFKGEWDADTNTPTLTNGGSHSAGDVYRVNVAGTQWDINFFVGDYVIYNGVEWERSRGADVATHTHNAEDITAGVFHVNRIPDLPVSKITDFESGVRSKISASSPISYNNSTGEITHVNSSSVRHVSDVQITNWNEAHGWGDFRDYGLGSDVRNITDLTLSTINTPQFFRFLSSATGSGGKSGGAVSLLYDGTPTVGILALNENTFSIGWKNGENATPVWRKVWHEGNFDPADYDFRDYGLGTLMPSKEVDFTNTDSTGIRAGFYKVADTTIEGCIIGGSGYDDRQFAFGVIRADSPHPASVYVNHTWGAVWQGKTELWHEGNFNPADYVPKTGGTFTGDVDYNNAIQWRVSSSNTAMQRADARAEGTDARLHWYGKSTAGGVRNFKHAWYDGSSYIDVTAENGEVTFSGALSIIHGGEFGKFLNIQRLGFGDETEWVMTPSVAVGGFTGDALRIRASGTDVFSFGADGNMWVKNNLQVGGNITTKNLDVLEGSAYFRIGPRGTSIEGDRVVVGDRLGVGKAPVVELDVSGNAGVTGNIAVVGDVRAFGGFKVGDTGKTYRHKTELTGTTLPTGEINVELPSGYNCSNTRIVDVYIVCQSNGTGNFFHSHSSRVYEYVFITNTTPYRILVKPSMTGYDFSGRPYVIVIERV